MSSRNIAVVLRAPPSHGRPAQLVEPHAAYGDTTAALYSKALDILRCPRGIATLRNYLMFWFWRDGASVYFEDPRIAEHLPRFYEKLQSYSPLIVIDSTMDPRVLGSHPRGQWEGDFDDFDPRKQALLVNKTCIDKVFVARAACNGNNTWEKWYEYWEREYEVSNMMMHELMHLFGTYLGHGEHATPPRIRGANPRSEANEGEGGEFGERGITGGLVEFDEDGHAWLFVGRTEARRIDPRSIAAIMQGNIPQDPNSPILTLLEDKTAARRDIGERPRLGALHGRTATILGTRGRSEQPSNPPLTFRHPGRNQPVNYLRQLTASPSPAPSTV